MDKENHHQGHTQKACNPSINAPTNHSMRLYSGIEDYGLKVFGAGPALAPDGKLKSE